MKDAEQQMAEFFAALPTLELGSESTVFLALMVSHCLRHVHLQRVSLALDEVFASVDREPPLDERQEPFPSIAATSQGV
jgi:hypothetical protein